MNNIKKTLAKKTLIIDLRPIQDFKYNGVTIASTNWIQELIHQSKNDQPIILWTNSHKLQPKIPSTWLNKQNIQHIHTTKPNYLLNLLWAFKLGKSINQILHLSNTENYFYFCPDIRPFKVDKNCLKSLIYFHDVAFLKFPKSLSLKSKIWFKLIRPQKVFDSATQILTNSKFSQKEISKTFNFKKSKKIKIIYPSLNKTLDYNQNFKHPVSKYFLTISTLQSRKNIHQLIDLFQQPEFQKQNLVILGNIDKMFKKYRLSIKSNIHFLHNLNQTDKHSLIKHSQAIIYPSLYEGFGLPILEAIRFNKPVYTYQIQPYIELFPNHIKDLQKLIPSQPQTTSKNSKNIYNLQTQVKKLRKTIYNID